MSTRSSLLDLDHVLIPVGGRWLADGGNGQYTVSCPYDGQPISTLAWCDAGEVPDAVVAANDELAAPLPLHERVAVLERAARLLHANAEEAATIIALEAAKPIRTARGEVARAVETLAISAAEGRALTGEMVPIDATPAGAGKLAFTLRRPIGVVAAICPFNFPLNLVAHKVGPAIAAGCPVIVKPAPATPLSAVLLARILEAAGLPPGWLQVMPGGADVGAALVAADGVRCVSFTGSADVGWSIAASVPQKRVRLELGSNAPLLVDEGADWEAAARSTATAAFSHAGQSCVSTQRVYVHERHVDDFLRTLLPLVGDLRVGHPLDEHADLSSVINRSEQERIHAWIDEAVAGGASVLSGGVLADGVLRPTVLAGVSEADKVNCEEVFGPVVTVTAVTDLDEAIDHANASRYGLQAGVFTPTLAGAMKAAARLEFGSVLVNEVPTFRADNQPYGGVKDSGNTREGPRYAIREMTEERLIVMNR